MTVPCLLTDWPGAGSVVTTGPTGAVSLKT